jgi:hypothetical protein
MPISAHHILVAQHGLDGASCLAAPSPVRRPARAAATEQC